LGHGLIYRKWESLRDSMTPSCLAKCIAAQVVCFLSWDLPYFALSSISHQVIEILGVNRVTNRLNANRLYGPRVLVVGNGPSAMDGEQYGDEIDKFDEVVRFNNFQCKVGGLEAWVGKKTTVHFSDGVLYPTYTEYHVPGATVVLSLFATAHFIAGSYLILRAAADLQYPMVLRFMKDPKTTWIDHASIERLQKAIGLIGIKHPTSGMLAIDYFVNKPGVQLPVIIHGFDFFEGPKIHYYDNHEPLYERINNNIGVNMHSPQKEKVYVQKLIEEGKVMFLKDVKRH